MIKIITFILLLIACLITYTLLIKTVPKKDPTQTIQEEIVSSKEVKTIQESPPQLSENTKKESEQNNKLLPKVKKTVTPKDNLMTIPSVELKYYNLSLEKDYNEYYNSKEKDIINDPLPPLGKDEVEEENDFNINVTPEINYNKQTKELTIDGVQIQLEKKF